MLRVLIFLLVYGSRTKSESPAPGQRSLTSDPYYQSAEQQAEFKKLEESLIKKSGIIYFGKEQIRATKDDFIHMKCLGSGTCGVVNQMRHRSRSELIMAVKQMQVSSNYSNENKRIMMDLDVITKCSGCPNIVQCMGIFFSRSEVWICMEVMSTCLDKLLKDLKQPFPEHVLGKVAVSIIKALDYLKVNHNMMHRDIKPSNMLISSNGEVKLCDFGISGQLKDSIAKSSQLGCIGYMAPERLQKHQYDVRADIWSLGISLIELATGHFPYGGVDFEIAIVSKILHDPPPVLPADGNFTQAFRSFMQNCLTRNQADRPKYPALKRTEFYLKHDVYPHNVNEWYSNLSIEHRNDEATQEGTFDPSVPFWQLLGSPASSPASTVTPSSDINHTFDSTELVHRAGNCVEDGAEGPSSSSLEPLSTDLPRFSTQKSMPPSTLLPKEAAGSHLANGSEKPGLNASAFLLQSVLRSQESSGYGSASSNGSPGCLLCRSNVTPCASTNSHRPSNNLDLLSSQRNHNCETLSTSINCAPPVTLRVSGRLRQSVFESRRNAVYDPGEVTVGDFRNHTGNSSVSVADNNSSDQWNSHLSTSPILFPYNASGGQIHMSRYPYTLSRDPVAPPQPHYSYTAPNSSGSRARPSVLPVSITPPPTSRLNSGSGSSRNPDAVGSEAFLTYNMNTSFSHTNNNAACGYTDCRNQVGSTAVPSATLTRPPRSASASGRKLHRAPACRWPAMPYDVQMATSGLNPVFTFVPNSICSSEKGNAQAAPPPPLSEPTTSKITPETTQPAEPQQYHHQYFWYAHQTKPFDGRSMNVSSPPVSATNGSGCATATVSPLGPTGDIGKLASVAQSPSSPLPPQSASSASSPHAHRYCRADDGKVCASGEHQPQSSFFFPELRLPYNRSSSQPAPLRNIPL
uniref:mitogen-activated protein kinase kinase n=1 Tax=Schistocephalus solidus TaxID=70667 RepID=A0A0X3P5X1_SCHSO